MFFLFLFFSPPLRYLFSLPKSLTACPSLSLSHTHTHSLSISCSVPFLSSTHTLSTSFPFHFRRLISAYIQFLFLFPPSLLHHILSFLKISFTSATVSPKRRLSYNNNYPRRPPSKSSHLSRQESNSSPSADKVQRHHHASLAYLHKQSAIVSSR